MINDENLHNACRGDNWWLPKAWNTEVEASFRQEVGTVPNSQKHEMMDASLLMMKLRLYGVV
jgi:hypothetical protein